MANMIDLTKKVEIVLTKRSMPNPPVCRVGFALDISGSMEHNYRDGTVQSLTERIMAIAMKFDDNGSLDVRPFDDEVSEVVPATEANYHDFVERQILRNSRVHKFNGTNYAPPMENLLSNYFPGFSMEKKGGRFGGLFGGSKSGPSIPSGTHQPALIIFITDGENSDQARTRQVIEAAHGLPVYWQFVGIGTAHLGFIKGLGDQLDNAGFQQIRDLRNTTDEQIFEGLISEELVNWFKKF